MEQITVYDGEHFERGRLWYIIFLSFISFFIFICILSKNLTGAIVLFFMLGGYILVSLIPSSRKIKLTISDEGLKIGGTFNPWTEISGFVLEIDPKDQQLKNIVIVKGNLRSIHTFADSADNIKSFILRLSDILPMLDGFEQGFVDKLVRRLKI